MTGKYTMDYWETVAGPKWVHSQAPLDALLAPFAEPLQPVISNHGTGHIIDVGCGCGATTLLARETAPDARITALDVSRPMLDLAKSRVRTSGDTQTRFIHGDASAHPIEPGSVDLLISRFGLMFFSDPVAAFAHMGRWLSPGGTMSFMVWGAPADNHWLADPLAALAHHLPDPTAPGTGPGPFAFASADHRAEVFGAAGLKVLAAESVIRPVIIDGTIEQRMGFYAERGPILAALEASTPEQAEAIHADLRAWVESVSVAERITLQAAAVHITLRTAATTSAAETDPSASR